MIYISILIFLGCTNSTQENKLSDVLIEDIDETENADTTDEILYFVEINNAEIVKIDKYNSRFFLTIDKEILTDNSAINEIICDVEFWYETDSNFHISFFTQKKWANYKDELFKENSKFSKEEYKNWMNDYYLGEFDFNKRKISTYPTAENNKNKREVYIDKCVKY